MYITSLLQIASGAGQQLLQPLQLFGGEADLGRKKPGKNEFGMPLMTEGRILVQLRIRGCASGSGLSGQYKRGQNFWGTFITLSSTCVQNISEICPLM